MGDIADMMLEGILCEGCGVYLEDGGGGYPQRCSACAEEDRPIPASKRPQCPHCNRRPKNEEGLRNHLKDKHGVET